MILVGHIHGTFMDYMYKPSCFKTWDNHPISGMLGVSQLWIAVIHASHAVLA